MSRCRSCGAEVQWRRNNVTGRAAPIDTQPTLNGNIEVIGNSYIVLSAQRLEEARQTDEPVLFLNHFATCPKAKDHR